jgi:hypothetical protein
MVDERREGKGKRRFGRRWLNMSNKKLGWDCLLEETIIHRYQ